jgi:hypothetical protein
MKDYAQHIKELREWYITASKEQRVGVARDRMEDPCCRPNILITSVSAIEGAARAIVLEQQSAKGKSVQSTYKKVKWEDPVALIEKWICQEIQKTPEELFSKDCWEEFKWAVEYRNLLIHECTFLSQSYSIPLIKACENVWNRLKNIRVP